MDNNSTEAVSGTNGTEPGLSVAVVTMGVIYSFGLVGNVIVLVTFLWSRKLRTPQNSFIMSLAVADLLALSQCPLVMTTMWKGCQFYGDDVCLFSACLTAFSYTASIVSIVMVAVGRYVSIVKTHQKDLIFTWPRCALIQGGIFALSMLSVAPVWSGSLKKATYLKEPHICLISGDDTVIYDVMMSLFAFAIPCVIVSCAYVQIYVTFRKSKKSVETHNRRDSGSTRTRDAAKQRQEMRLALQLLIIFCLFVVSWAPFTLLILLDGKSDHPQPRALYQFCQQLVIANSAVNPPIYFYFHTVYRQEVLRLFRLDGNRPCGERRRGAVVHRPIA